MWVLLDTTVLIDFLRGRRAVERVEALHAAGDVTCTSIISVEEIARGVRRQETAAVERLFAGLIVLPIGFENASQAGTWRRDFAARGKTLLQADRLIAAAALEVQAVLATGNPADFPMRELRVEHWPVGD